MLVAGALALAGCGGLNQYDAILSQYCSGCGFVYATTTTGSLVAARLNRATGGLSGVRLIPGPADSRGMDIAVNESRQGFLYVSDPEADAIRVYAVDLHSGNLAPAEIGPYALRGVTGNPAQVMVLGNFVYLADTGGAVFGFSMGADGSLTAVPGSPFAAGAGAAHLCHGAVATGANTYVGLLYASDSSAPDGGISGYLIGSDGSLTPAPGSPYATQADGGPQGMVCNGKFLYAALPQAAAIAGFAINSDGSLTRIAGPPFAASSGVASLLNIEGYLYARDDSGNGGSFYKADPASGQLTVVAGSPLPAFGSDNALGWASAGELPPMVLPGGIAAFTLDAAAGAFRSPLGSPLIPSVTPLVAVGLLEPVLDPP